jgi:O-antigen ligase
MRKRELAQFSILMAIVCLSIRLGGKPDAPNLKLTEMFIALGAALTIGHVTLKSRFPAGQLRTLLRSVFSLVGILYGSLLLGTIVSLLIAESIPIKLVLVEYARILASTVFFLLILYYGYARPRFIMVLYFAFLAPVVIAVLSWLPGAVEGLGMTGGGTRFRGLFEDPNYFASFTLISAVFLYALILHARGKLLQRSLAAAALLPITTTLLWSGSRSGWLGLLAGLVVVTLTSVRYSTARVRTTITAVALILGTLLGGFALLNDEQHTELFARAGVRFESRAITPDSPATADLPPRLPLISVGQTALTHGQDRFNIWRQVVEHFQANPLGFGPGYYQIINIRSAGEHRSTHSIIFETMVTGGIIALGLLVYVAYLSVKLWITRKDADYVWTGIYAAFIGVLVSSLFLDSLSLRWLWALGAMLVSYSMRSEHNNRKLGAGEQTHTQSFV